MTYFVNFRKLNDRLFGKELFIRFTVSAFRKLLSVYVFSYFPFGFESRIWDLIVSVPDHCLSFYRHAYSLADRQTGRQSDRQSDGDGLMNMQTDGQTGRQTVALQYRFSVYNVDTVTTTLLCISWSRRPESCQISEYVTFVDMALKSRILFIVLFLSNLIKLWKSRNIRVYIRHKIRNVCFNCSYFCKALRVRLRITRSRLCGKCHHCTRISMITSFMSNFIKVKYIF